MRGSERLLHRAGIRRKSALAVYCIFVTAVLCCALLGGHGLAAARRTRSASMLGGMVAALLLGFMLPKQVLHRLVKRYRRKLQEALPDTVDLLGIVLGTGPGARSGDDAGERGDAVHLSGAGQRIRDGGDAGARRAGARRWRSTSSCGGRGSRTSSSLAAMIMQSEKFGTSLAQALKVYADALRTRRRLRAEAAVGKAGIKMLFPIVVFILPVLFVITLVPGMLSVLKDLKMLGGGR